ncbi:RagB/SusD family nutrient uptake outer membrane protein [Persicobacter diffluens]
MMMKKITGAFLAIVLMLGLDSCISDLDVTPIDPNLNTADKVYQTQDDLREGLAKIYAGFSVSGQQGPAGQGDLSGFDEGHSQYLRGLFVCQELPTEEVINGWNDGNLPKVSQMTWGDGNEFIRSFYYRAIYQVSLANEFIRQASRFVGQEGFERVPEFIAEARYLRAFSYWHALDLFGNGVPFVTEANEVGAFLPLPAGENARGPELYKYIESEALAIIGDNPEDNANVLPDAEAAVFGEADKAAAYMLLGKLYLNHAVYLGSEDNGEYQKGLQILQRLYDAGVYSLYTTDGPNYSAYEALFLADNQLTSNEIIWAFTFDGLNAKTFGGTTYIINASMGGAMDQTDYGTADAWGGNRTTPEFVDYFEVDSPNDGRALFFTEGQSKEIQNQDQFTEGYAVVKFKNKKQDGSDGSNLSEGFADTNFPVFRLADAYLMTAELEWRINGSISAASIGRINEIRTRGGASTVNSITDPKDFLLKERARELYWEGHRRTDLVRFGELVGDNYVWAFKGGIPSGTSVNSRYNLMPIPSTDVNANPNLKQNPGY